MHDIQFLLDNLHYDPQRRIFWIGEGDISRGCPRMKDFFKDIRVRGTEEFNRAFKSYMYDKKHTVAYGGEMVELSGWELDVLKMCQC